MSLLVLMDVGSVFGPKNQLYELALATNKFVVDWFETRAHQSRLVGGVLNGFMHIWETFLNHATLKLMLECLKFLFSINSFL